NLHRIPLIFSGRKTHRTNAARFKHRRNSENLHEPQIPPRVDAITIHPYKYNGITFTARSTVPGWRRGIGP
ncbi:MAG: hypothetical protein ACFFCW_33385, partial [Candidatus Hodarchaeota archaeon]